MVDVGLNEIDFKREKHAHCLVWLAKFNFNLIGVFDVFSGLICQMLELLVTNHTILWYL